MRVLLILLAIGLLSLQYRLWVGEQGMREVWRLRAAVEAQRVQNAAQLERNRRLSAEVNDLKTGLAALEERARSELGMVGSNETFYQIVSASTPAPLTSTTVTARAR